MKDKLWWFIYGIGAGFLALALIIVIVGKNVEEIPTPFGPIKFFVKEEVAPPQVLMEIKGEVKDIFDNPRKGVIVTIPNIEKYSLTDQNGQFRFSNVPDCDYIKIEAYYGEESDSKGIEISRDEDVTRKTISIKLPLILENPNIKVEACLCEGIANHEPVGKFEGENPRIPVNINTLWCFVRVFGPLKYEIDKTTKITYRWYYKGEFLHEYTQDVGFNPSGWRTNASKSLNGRVGEWRLEINTTTHKQLASLYFETY